MAVMSASGGRRGVEASAEGSTEVSVEGPRLQVNLCFNEQSCSSYIFFICVFCFLFQV